MRAIRQILLGLACGVASFASAGATPALPWMNDAQAWRASASDQVKAVVRVNAADQTLCLDYDFQGNSGYAVASRELPVAWPTHPNLRFWVKGTGGANHLQLKWVDASQENVWWAQWPNFKPSAQWQAFKVLPHQLEFAWGPTADRRLTRTQRLEWVVAAGKAGGKGSVCVAALTLAQGEAPKDSALLSLQRVGQDLVGAFDEERDLSGLRVRWPETVPRQPYTVQVAEPIGAPETAGSSAPRTMLRSAVPHRPPRWRTVQTVSHAQGPIDWIWLGQVSTRSLRLQAMGGGALPEGLTIETVPAGATTTWKTQDDAWKALAAQSPRGSWPRAYVSEQNYWTLVGLPGQGDRSSLLSEDGAVELGVHAPSIEPLLRLRYVDGRERWVSWADVQMAHAWGEGLAALPEVRWRHSDFSLDIEAFATPAQGQTQGHARYRFEAQPGAALQGADLWLFARPLQVNPPQQFLGQPGGFVGLHQVQANARQMQLNGQWHLRLWPQAQGVALVAAQHGLGPVQARQLGEKVNAQSPDGTLQAVWFIPNVHQHPLVHLNWRQGPQWPASVQGAESSDALRAQAIGLARAVASPEPQLRVPAAPEAFTQSVQAALSHMLRSSRRVALQPGTRAYARTWVRDGAMMASALVRTGHHRLAREFVEWYEPYLFESGKVPCCVDARGRDPVTENDSHGQFIFAVAQVWRYRAPGDGVDRVWLEKRWKSIRKVLAWMDHLRTQAERPVADKYQHLRAAMLGLVPASISHEGYSAFPVHAYWDNFWTLRGYRDALHLAQVLGDAGAEREIARALSQFSHDLRESLSHTMRLHGLDTLPGSVELGDFDPTSSTVVLDPAQATHLLPPGSLHTTFRRYLDDLRARAHNQKAWREMTPYELRSVGALARMGEAQAAWEAMDFFLSLQRPAPWRQWAEVVMREPRAVQFLGDMPHAWIASDFLRAALDLFWYERESESGQWTAVLGAGWPASWWDDGRVALQGLRTLWGELRIDLQPLADGWQLRLTGLPPKTAPSVRLTLPAQGKDWQLLDAQGQLAPSNKQPHGQGWEQALPGAPDAQGVWTVRVRRATTP